MIILGGIKHVKRRNLSDDGTRITTLRILDGLFDNGLLVVRCEENSASVLRSYIGTLTI